MALPIYLAMTPWEMAHRELPPHCGWMACHFSAYGQGLSNIPTGLPEGSLLILNDRIPPWGHDPALIARQLRAASEQLAPRGILMDLQRPYNEETAMIVQAVCELPFPTAVTENYAAQCAAAVFLSPVPLNRTLREHIAPWSGREIWLETDCTGLTLTLTEAGCNLCAEEVLPTEPVFSDEKLHCHYSTRVREDRAVFSLTRYPEDIQALLQEAQSLGITLAAGLYQELSPVLFVHGAS